MDINSKHKYMRRPIQQHISIIYFVPDSKLPHLLTPLCNTGPNDPRSVIVVVATAANLAAVA